MRNAQSKMKVLLVTSVTGASEFYRPPAPPTGLYRLRHYLRGRDIECDILDLDLHPESRQHFVAQVGQRAYDIVGMSVSHYKMSSDLDFLWELRGASKKSGNHTLFIAGGQEATLNYQQWLISGFDLIVLGFAEKRLFDLCTQVASGFNGHVKQIVGKMDGVAFLDESGHVAHRPAPVLSAEEFRELSFDQVLTMPVPYEDYWRHIAPVAGPLTFGSNRFVVETVRLYTSSHCPRRCGFCSSQAFLPESQRRPAPIFMLSGEDVHSLVVDHIERFGARGFLFSDDTFFIGGRRGILRLTDFCTRTIESKRSGEIAADVVFNAQACVADCLVQNKCERKEPNHQLLKLLREAGFHNVGVGVETFSDHLLRAPSIHKVGIDEADCCNVLDAILQEGMVPTINLILGIPESTVDELIHTMKVAVRYVEKGAVAAVTPIMSSCPGAPLHGREGYPAGTKQWKNPFTGAATVISDYFIPHDPGMQAIARIDPATAWEIERIQASFPWTIPTVPKTISGLAYFIAAAKILDNPELADQFTRFTERLLKQHEEPFLQGGTDKTGK